MNVLVDTCIWSLALRRNTTIGTSAPYRDEFKELIHESRVRIIGPVRQEILSGIKANEQFELLKKHLSAFPDLPTITADFEQAAHFYNLARGKGFQGSNTDFLICAVSIRCDLSIFTVDKNFEFFQRILPIRLHGLRG